MSLHNALRAGLEHAPVLKAAVSRSEAMRAERDMAGALPNPELSFEAENIGGEGPYEDFDGAEVTYGISQLVELPGKRSGRREMAEGVQRKSLHERDAARLDLIRAIVVAYAEAVAAETDMKILEDERGLASGIYETVSAKVDAGKEPPIQKKKAALALSASDMALDRARRSVTAARQILVRAIGADADGFILSKDTLPPMKKPPELSFYSVKLSSSPDLMAYDSDIDVASSALALEKAASVPDPTIGLGLRDLRADDERAFVAGLSIPFPVFDLNRANIRKAGHEYNAVRLDRETARLSAESELIKLYENLTDAFRTHEALQREILPGAVEAFEIAQVGYSAGKFPYLDVLDAQRTLFEARRQENRAKLDYYRALAAIDRLTAMHALSQGDEK